MEPVFLMFQLAFSDENIFNLQDPITRDKPHIKQRQTSFHMTNQMSGLVFPSKAIYPTSVKFVVNLTQVALKASRTRKFASVKINRFFSFILLFWSYLPKVPLEFVLFKNRPLVPLSCEPLSKILLGF